MAKIMALLFMVGIFGVLLFGGFIYPIWMIVHCANSERSGGKKAAWIIFMILIWPIVGMIYGLLASGRRLFQWLSIFYFIGGTAFIVVAILGIQWSSKAVVQQVSQSINRIDQMNTDGLTSENVRELKNDANTLLGETQVALSFKVCGLRNTGTSLALLELFDIYSRDNRITPTEYADFINKFKSRDILDSKALQQRIRSLRGIKISN